MKTQIAEDGFKLWLSANETWMWAHKPGAVWPCSQVAGHSLFVEYDRHGMVDLCVGGGATTVPDDIDNGELTAIVSDYMVDRLPKGHFCHSYLDVVTQ